MLTQSPDGAEGPVPHVIECGVGSRRRRRGAARLDDRGTALLHGRDEVLFDPGLIDPRRRGLPFDLRVEHVGVLSGRVIAPDRHPRHGRDRYADLGRELSAVRPVVVEPGHCREPLARDRARVVHRDQAVGVRRVADHEHAHVVGGARGERLPCAVKIAPLTSSSSLRSIPFVRGRDPTRSAKFTPSNAASSIVGGDHAGHQRQARSR